MVQTIEGMPRVGKSDAEKEDNPYESYKSPNES